MSFNEWDTMSNFLECFNAISCMPQRTFRFVMVSFHVEFFRHFFICHATRPYERLVCWVRYQIFPATDEGVIFLGEIATSRPCLAKEVKREIREMEREITGQSPTSYLSVSTRRVHDFSKNDGPIMESSFPGAPDIFGDIITARETRGNFTLTISFQENSPLNEIERRDIGRFVNTKIDEGIIDPCSPNIFFDFNRSAIVDYGYLL